MPSKEQVIVMKNLKVTNRQAGAVLVISLVLLLVLTLIGVAGMNSSTMQERMAANAQNSNRAFQGRKAVSGLYWNNFMTMTCPC